VSETIPFEQAESTVSEETPAKKVARIVDGPEMVAGVPYSRPSGVTVFQALHIAEGMVTMQPKPARTDTADY